MEKSGGRGGRGGRRGKGGGGGERGEEGERGERRDSHLLLSWSTLCFAGFVYHLVSTWLQLAPV